MKNLLKYSLVFVMLLSFYQLKAQGNAETLAKEILKAYKTKDVELLKKHMTGIMAYVVNDSYFDSDDAKPLVTIAKAWDGDIKEIRYSKGDIMGKTITLASVYFSDNANGNYNVVTLSSFEGSDWKAFALGISDISKDEYEQASTEIPDEKNTSESKPVNDHSEFSIEMANGDTYKKPTTEKLLELLKSLNDDNFFLILNSKDGFLQSSTSDKGYIVQYSNDEGMFEAEAYFTIEMLNDIFTAYINNADWKSKAKWTAM